ncbi:MAG: hypothetical protein C3F02_04155 [Parcubacteria group bacterium]|nr:MAG: hypothetical protein C3F02_04155 [Parcubacteria group bacterium]
MICLLFFSGRARLEGFKVLAAARRAAKLFLFQAPENFLHVGETAQYVAPQLLGSEIHSGISVHYTLLDWQWLLGMIRLT